MRTLFVTNCTSRKRDSGDLSKHARNLSPGSLDTVVREWIARIGSDGARVPADRLYCGRVFTEVMTAAQSLGAWHPKVYVASAGLGLVPVETRVPAYGATIARPSDDDLLAKIPGASSRDWWRAITAISPFSDTPRVSRAHLTLVALSRPYLAMLMDDLTAWDALAPGRLRLFARLPRDQVPDPLRRALMPYDGRLDDPGGPLPGTHGDFAQRALRHFAERVVPKAPAASAAVHAAIVTQELAALKAPTRIKRRKCSDQEIQAFIKTNWHEVNGCSTRMLRKLRDHLGVACEQSRFRHLFREVAMARQGRLVP